MSEENGNTNPIHEDFINSLPEELREDAPKYLEHWDPYVQEKFTANAEANKEWEPYQAIDIEYDGPEGPVKETVNIRDIPQEELQELLAFHKIASDEDQFDKWYDEIGKLRGKSSSVAAEVEEGEYVDPELAELKTELADMRQWRAQREAEEAKAVEEAQAQQSIEWVNGEIGKIKKDYPDLTDEHVEAICALAGRYPPSEDIVQKGFKDFQKLMGDAEKDFFKKKSNQPSPAERGGRPNTAAEIVTSYDDAGEAAKARIREALRSGG